MPFRGLARTISIWFGSQSLCSQLHLPLARHTTQSWTTSGPKTYCKRPFCSPLTARKGIVVGSHLWSSQSAPFAFCPTLYMSILTTSFPWNEKKRVLGNEAVLPMRESHARVWANFCPPSWSHRNWRLLFLQVSSKSHLKLRLTSSTSNIECSIT